MDASVVVLLNLTQSQAPARNSRDAHELNTFVTLVLPLSLVLSWGSVLG